METFPPTAVRFIKNDFLGECIKATALIDFSPGDRVTVSLDVAHKSPLETDEGIASLLPLLEVSIASRTLGRILLIKYEKIGSQEAWDFIPRFVEPCWLEMKLNRLRSSGIDERARCLYLRALVDSGSMDVVACKYKYYGIPPLIYAYDRTLNADYDGRLGDLNVDQLEAMRKLEVELVPYAKAKHLGRKHTR